MQAEVGTMLLQEIAVELRKMGVFCEYHPVLHDTDGDRMDFLEVLIGGSKGSTQRFVVQCENGILSIHWNLLKNLPQMELWKTEIMLPDSIESFFEEIRTLVKRYEASQFAV